MSKNRLVLISRNALTSGSVEDTQTGRECVSADFRQITVLFLDRFLPRLSRLQILVEPIRQLRAVNAPEVGPGMATVFAHNQLDRHAQFLELRFQHFRLLERHDLVFVAVNEQRRWAVFLSHG